MQQSSSSQILLSPPDSQVTTTAAGPAASTATVAAMYSPIYILDNYYLSITLIVTIAYQLFFFAIAFSLKFDKLTGK